MSTAHGAEQDPTKQPAGRSRRASKPRKESLLVPEARGGQIAQDGFDFQRAYVPILLLESLQDPAFTSILVDAAEDLEIRSDSQDTVERRAIQVKDYRATAAKAGETIARFEKLNRDSPGTWTGSAIACAELDETLKRIHYGLERYRDLRSSYPDDDPILANTRVEVGGQIDAAKLPVESVLEQVTFEPGLQSYKEEAWVRARALYLLQEAYPGIDQASADEIYLRLYKLVSESAGQIIERQQVMAVIDAVRTGLVKTPVDFAPLPLTTMKGRAQLVPIYKVTSLRKAPAHTVNGFLERTERNWPLVRRFSPLRPLPESVESATWHVQEGGELAGKHGRTG